MSTLKAIPTCSKITLKGNVPAKLSAKGYNPKELVHYTQAIGADEIEGLREACAAVATTIITATLARKGVEVWESEEVNGEGYIQNWHTQLTEDLVTTAIGTASQGRAFKNTLVANSQSDDSVSDDMKLVAEDFISTKSATKAVSVEDSPFA